MKKKLLCWLMAAGMTLSLAACSKNAPAENGAVNPGSAGTEVTEQTTSGDLSEEKDDTQADEQADAEDVAAGTDGADSENTAEETVVEEPVITMENAKAGDVVDGIVKVDKLPPVKIPDNDALNFVRDVEIGWNLGNTFDASDCDWLSNEMDYESAWCGTKTTKELISELKAAGFKSIRIPVSWHNHVDADYNISEDWMNRVEEVVGWAYDEGMYIIINIHHDNDEKHEFPSYAKLDQSKKYVTAIWKQVADRFADYDEHLIFETMNEPRMVNTDVEWWVDDTSDIGKETLDCINQLNQVIVDTIRDNGKGYNKTRYIMAPGYAASPNFALSDAYVLPDDSKADAENRIIVSVHAYTPYNFALNQDKSQGASDKFSVTSSKNREEIDWFMSSLYNKFILKGTPVIIGEFGALDKDNTDARMQFTAYYISTARHYGMSAFVWDNNALNTSGENFRLIDRATLNWAFPEIVDQMMYYCRDDAE